MHHPPGAPGQLPCLPENLVFAKSSDRYRSQAGRTMCFGVAWETGRLYLILQKKLNGAKLAIGVDRLDYTNDIDAPIKIFGLRVQCGVRPRN